MRKTNRRLDGKKLAPSTINWQKGYRNAMLAQRGMQKIMALMGRGIAVQQVKIARGV